MKPKRVSGKNKEAQREKENAVSGHGDHNRGDSAHIFFYTDSPKERYTGYGKPKHRERSVCR